MEGLVYLLLGGAALGVVGWLALIIWQRVEYVRFQRGVREVRQSRATAEQLPDPAATPSVVSTPATAAEPLDSEQRQVASVANSPLPKGPLVWIHAPGEAPNPNGYLPWLVLAIVLTLLLVFLKFSPAITNLEGEGTLMVVIAGCLVASFVAYQQRFRISPLVVELHPGGFMPGHATPIRVSFVALDDRAWLSVRWQCGTQFNYVSVVNRRGMGQVDETLAEGVVLKQLPVTAAADGLLWEGVIDIPVDCLPPELPDNIASRLRGVLVVTLRRTKSAEISNSYPIRFRLPPSPAQRRAMALKSRTDSRIQKQA